MSVPLISIHEGLLSFGGKPLFSDITLHILKGDKIGLVGRNGCGKSTLFKILAHQLELDGGERYDEPGITIGYLPQSLPIDLTGTVQSYVTSGLKQKDIEEHAFYKVDMVLEPLDLQPDWQLNALSGGQLRRVALAKSLVAEPDILLLDEPTNHLDIAAIEWLEEFIKAYRGGLICISHDRAFLENTTNKTFWLDRGIMRVSKKGYKYFDEWVDILLSQEAREISRLSKKVELENHWLSRGVTARRKRNQQRLKQVYALRDKLRQDKNKLHKVTQKIHLDPLEPAQRSKMVFECEGVSKAFEEKQILKDFTIRIMRGEKIGIIGKNGSGKTSFIKLLLGKLEQDAGRIRRGKKLEISWFDQNRELLDPTKTVWETLIPSGGDHIVVGDKMRHIMSYLKDFMFDPKQAHSKISMLSGGEANRVMLAKILANPGSLLILDEPTNDLDMDTLDMLQDILVQYEGTLIMVSHDRNFIDRVASRTIVFEGDGNVEWYIGGYSDYLSVVKPKAPIKVKPVSSVVKSEKSITPPAKLSYKLQRELNLMPAKIEELQSEISRLEDTLSNPDLYQTDRDSFFEITETLSVKQVQLLEAEERWLELMQLQDRH